jgi:hypothetical protein
MKGGSGNSGSDNNSYNNCTSGMRGVNIFNGSESCKWSDNYVNNNKNNNNIL